MCTPEAVTKALAGMDRRDFLHAALPAAVAAVVGPPPKPAAPRRRGAIAAARLADLTHDLTPAFPFIPARGLTGPFEMTNIATMEKNGVYANRWSFVEHIGTHIDAPSHFVSGQPHLHELPAEDLIAPIAVIDVRAKAARDHDYALTIDDVRDWEKRHGRLPAGAAVFLFSGWASRVGDPKAFLNADASGTMHFPGSSAEACEFLWRERDIAGVGVARFPSTSGRTRRTRPTRRCSAAAGGRSRTLRTSARSRPGARRR